MVEYSNNLCANFCPIEQPFYFINEQRCVSFCNINDIFEYKCVFHYKDFSPNIKEQTTEKLINFIKNNFTDDIRGKLIITILSRWLNENRLNNIRDDCETILRTNYNLSNTQNFFLLIKNLNKETENTSKEIYNAIYILNGEFNRIDLNACTITENHSTNIEIFSDSIINNEPSYEAMITTYIESSSNNLFNNNNSDDISNKNIINDNSITDYINNTDSTDYTDYINNTDSTDYINNIEESDINTYKNTLLMGFR